ncbi:MAG: DUF1924 domain-containing protein [Magnetococcus sp. YQC-5]
MKKSVMLCGLSLMGLLLTEGHAATVDDLLLQYQREGATGFSAAAGQELLNRTGQGGPEAEGKNCASCHTTHPAKPGQHAKTGKVIEPLAPVANPERLQDAAKVEKWFLRNCKGTLGRICTPQEKGDFLTFLLSVR